MKIKDEIRRYGRWAGHPDGVPEDTSKCIEEIHYSIGAAGYFKQCSRKRGHGEDGLYCKIHDPKFVAAKRAEQDRELRIKWKLSDRDFKIKDARYKISEIARQVFKQEASFDDLEKAVINLENYIMEKDNVN